jgi:hypothetical protein
MLGIRNAGASGIQNVYVEMSMQSPSKDVDIRHTLDDRLFSWEARSERAEFDEPDNFIDETDDGWQFWFEWAAIQPKRTRILKPALLIASRTDTQIDFTAKIFAGSFPEPLLLSAQLDLVIRRKKCLVSDLIPDSDTMKEALATDIHTRRYIYTPGGILGGITTSQTG